MLSNGIRVISAFAGACVLGSLYGFLQGAWPFGLVEAIWALVAVRRWWRYVAGGGKSGGDHHRIPLREIIPGATLAKFVLRTAHAGS